MEDIEYFCNTVVIKKKVMLFQKMFNFTKKVDLNVRDITDPWTLLLCK